MSSEVAIKYKRLKKTNPRVDLMSLRILKALYRGGAHLLKDEKVMESTFPKYVYENPQAYAERKSRAFYENLFALVINQMSAGLAQDPLRVVPAATETSGATVEPYWADMMLNATAYDEDGSEQRGLDQVMRDLCVEALVCGWSWLQVELPLTHENIMSRADQDEAGDLNAYLCSWPTDQVTDWQEKAGKLLWVRTYECGQTAETPDASRDKKTHTWTIWYPDRWVTYVVEESTSPNEVKPLPNDEDLIEFKDSGKHSFGRVPWIRLDLCTPGTYLHVGDFIESACRSYFNRSCGEAFQWTQYNFQQLYEFLAPETPGLDNDVSEAQKDPGRAKRGLRSPGAVHVRGSEDHAEFIGPDMGGASAGREALQDLRDSILRMAAQMALSQDSSGAMLRRSGESKKQDAIGQEVLLGAIGKRLLTTARQTKELIVQARGENSDDAPNVEGYARFNVSDASELIDQGVKLEQVQVPSAAYQIERKYRMAITDLGDGASDELKQQIHDQLTEAITQENLNWTMQPPEAPPEEPETEDDSGFGGEA